MLRQGKLWQGTVDRLRPRQQDSPDIKSQRQPKDENTRSPLVEGALLPAENHRLRPQDDWQP
jgi:hypothetical protein